MTTATAPKFTSQQRRTERAIERFTRDPES